MSAHDRRPPFYLGIDLGGTNIKSGVVDDVGQPLSAVSLETEADRGPEVGIANLAESGRRAVSASGLSWDQITGVGLGSPGTMDLPSGMLLEPPNLPGWNQLPIRDLLAKKLDKQTVLQNDANAAAYGEYWAGTGGTRAASSSSLWARESAAESSKRAESSRAVTATAASAATSSFRWTTPGNAPAAPTATWKAMPRLPPW